MQIKRVVCVRIYPNVDLVDCCGVLAPVNIDLAIGAHRYGLAGIRW